MDSYSMGEGKERSLDIAYGGDIHTILRKVINAITDQWQEIEESLLPKFGIATSINRLKKLSIEQRSLQFKDRALLFNCWEWSSNRARNYDYKEIRGWKYVNMMKQIRDKFPNTFWRLTKKEIFLEAHRISNNLLTESNIFQQINNSEGPPMLATDGSHLQGNEFSAPDDMSHSTTSAVVVCLPNLLENESRENGA